MAASILAVPWSDHNLVLVVCHSILCKPQYSPWGMNDSLLPLKEIQADIIKASADYFRLNEESVSSPLTLWETYKAVLRGHIIQLAVKHKLKQLLAWCTLDARLESLSMSFKQSPTPANRKLLDQTRMELDLCLTNEVERTLCWARQNGMPRQISQIRCWLTGCVSGQKARPGWLECCWP